MMVVQFFLVRSYYFICCLLIASGNITTPPNTKDSDPKININSTTDALSSTTSEAKDTQSVNLKTVSRSRRSNLHSKLNEQFNLNAGENAAFNSAFRYNDQIMRNLLKTHSPNHARSHFFLNLITPLDRRTTRYGSWDDHSVMHFGKRSVSEEEDNDSLSKENSLYETDPTSSKENGIQVEMEDMEPMKRLSDSWMDHNVMHFGKRDDEVLNGEEVSSAEILDEEKKSEDAWHNMMNFGKKSDSFWNDHNTMHFGKRDDPWHSMMSFGKKSENPWNDHNTLHFGKREDPWHSMMSFGKKSENPWNDHNTLHFGKREDPWHSMMSFGKRSENSWNDHNTLHFGKKDDPWHSMMSFGKRSDDLFHDHNTMHFGKREDPWHNMMSFGKKSLTADQNGNIINKDKLSTSENNTDDNSKNYINDIYLIPSSDMKLMNKRFTLESELPKQVEAKYEVPINHKYFMTDYKSDNSNYDESDVEIPNQQNYDDHENFEKRSNPWESHNTMHFGKKSDPWDLHNTMHFGKKSQPWDSHNTMHFGKKRDLNIEDISANLEQNSENSVNEKGSKKLPISKLAPTVNNNGMKSIDSEKKLRLKKRSIEETVSDSKEFDNDEETDLQESNLLNFDSQEELNSEVPHFGKRFATMNEKSFIPWDILYLAALEQKRDPWDSHNTLHFGKRFDPWDAHNTMHFGKKSDPWQSHNTMHFGKRYDPFQQHNTMHFGKRADPWDAHNTMHFGKRFDQWQSHNTMHFGKKSDPWDNHNTMHFGKKSDPWDNHNTMHFGKKSDPWDNHNTMHFGKKSDPWDNHNTMHFGKRESDQPPYYTVFNDDPKSELTRNDPPDNESSMLSKILQSRMNDSPSDTSGEQLLYRLLETADKISAADKNELKQGEISESDSNEPIPILVDNDQSLERNPDKRYMVPFQGPKSIIYPHAWLVSQIRRSVPSSRQYDLRVAEKKEDPINSYMHFGRR